MNGMLLPSATLLIIDVQNAIDDPTWSRWGGKKPSESGSKDGTTVAGLETGKTQGDSCAPLVNRSRLNLLSWTTRL